MREKKLFAVLGTAGIVIGLFMASSASAIPLKELVDNQSSLVSGDKIFSGFKAVPTGFGIYLNDPALIDVVPIQVGTDYGIEFKSLTPAAPMMYAGIDSYADLRIDFDVTVDAAHIALGWKIKDIELSFLANAPADGFAQVAETPLESNGTVVIDNTTISVQVPGGPMITGLDFSNTYESIHIAKNLGAVGGAAENTEIVWVKQTFSQIPEPATIFFLAMGIPAILRPRRVFSALFKSAPLMLVLAGLTGLVALPAQVNATPLQDLVTTPGSTIVQGDKEFSNFTVAIQGTGRFIANPSSIEVYGITRTAPDGRTQWGLGFSGLVAALSSPLKPNSTVTMTINYDVTALDPLQAVDAVNMVFNGVAIGAGSSASIIKTLTAGGNNLGAMTVAAPSPMGVYWDFSGVSRTVHVQDVIQLMGGPTGSATISIIDQTFSQPEPATLALISLAFPFIRRRPRR